MVKKKDSLILFKVEHSINVPKAIVIGAVAGAAGALTNVVVKKTIAKVDKLRNQRKENKKK